MAIRIQLRRDTAANWVSANPVLRAGEVGIETDTLKFKIGNGSSTWTQITNYANVTPSSLTNSLNDYILAADQGNPGGPAALDSNGDLIIPEDQIILWNDAAYDYTTTLTATQPTADRTITFPNSTGTVALTSDLPTQYTDELAQDAAAQALANGTHTNITVTYNDNANSISLAAAPGYTDEEARDAVAAALAAGTHTNITVTYDDNANSISLTGAQTYSDENAQDAVGNAVGNGLDYDDITGAISVDPSEFALSAVGSPTADINMASYKITSLAAPTSANDAATKAYVDNTTAGLNFHAAVHAATTANLDATYNNGTSGVGATLTANANEALVIDGHTLNADERVLVKNQTTGSQNGIYVVTATGDGSNPWILTRATDADNSPAGEIAYGDFCFVQSGSTNVGYGFIVNTTGTITIGTTAISYVQFNAGQVVVAGNGLTETTPGTLAINTAVTVDLNTAQTLTNKTITGTFTGNLTGNADTVTNGVYTNAANTITAASASTKPLIIKGSSSQSANLQEWQNSSGTVLANVDASGNIYSSGVNIWTGYNRAADGAALFRFTTVAGATYEQASITRGSGFNGNLTITQAGTGAVVVQNGSASAIGLILKGSASQTADLQQWQNSDGTVLASVASTGTIKSGAFGSPTDLGAYINFNSTSGAMLIGTRAASNIGVIVKGASSQSANLTEWQNSSGTALASINASGQFVGDGSQLTGIDGLPSQTGNNGKYLTTDGTTASWATLVVPIETGTSTLTANTATTISTTALSAFTSIEYMVSLKQGSKVRTSKVVVQTDGTSVDMTEFAITETGGTMTGVVISATTSGTDAVLQATVTDAATTNVDVKFSKVKL